MNEDGLGTATAPASSDILLTKRKRGRPRKDDSTVESSNSSASSRVKRRHRNDDLGSSDDVVIGQRVTGVLDGSFDAGYFLTVRVGDTNMVLRGLVFEPGLAVPVCSTNDVAPHVKMFQRSDLSVPATELKNFRPVYGHNLQSVSKSAMSVKPFQIISSQQNAHFDYVNGSLSKPSSRQSEEVNCSNNMFNKGASPVSPVAAEGGKASVLQPQMFFPEVKENTTTPRQVLSSKTGDPSFSTSQFEGGRHNAKQIPDVNECAQTEGPYIDGKEASLGTPRALLPADKMPVVNDTGIRNKDYTVSMVLDTELKIGTSQYTPEAEDKACVLSRPGSHECGGNQREKGKNLSNDQMHDTSVQESAPQSLHINCDQDPSDKFSQAKEVIFTAVPVAPLQNHQSEEKRDQLNETACGECTLPNVDSAHDPNLSHDASPQEYPKSERNLSLEMVEVKREADIPTGIPDFDKSASEIAAPKGSPGTIIVEESFERHKDDTIVPSAVGICQSVAVPAAESVDDSYLSCHGASLHEVYPIHKTDHSVEEVVTGEREVDTPMGIPDFDKLTSSTAAPNGSPSTIKVEESTERHIGDMTVPSVVGICESVAVPVVEPVDSNLSCHDEASPQEVYTMAKEDQSADMITGEGEADIMMVIPDFDKPISETTAPKGFPNTIKVEEFDEGRKGDAVVPSAVGLSQSVVVPGKLSPGVIRDEQLLESDCGHEISNENLNHVPLSSDNTMDKPVDEPTDLQVGLLVHNDAEIPDVSQSDNFS